LVPHSLQNFAPACNSALQFGQAVFISCAEPHSLQNFAPARNADPHFTHGTVAGATVAPQLEQNFDPVGIAIEHFGQGIVAAAAPPCDDCWLIP